MRRISNLLGDQGAVVSPALFRMGADYSDRTGQLKAGSFLIEENASMADIVNLITEISDQTSTQQTSAEAVQTDIRAVSETIDSNAASSEELAASAEELTAQAGTLQTLVANYQR